jgi:hypothetical protein
MTTEKRETVGLIGSDKVQGTAVYGERPWHYLGDEFANLPRSIRLGVRTSAMSMSLLRFRAMVMLDGTAKPRSFARWVIQTGALVSSCLLGRLRSRRVSSFIDAIREQAPQ